MTAELIPWAPAGWHLLRLGLAVLSGVLLTALPAAILLVRARRRQQRLRRQLARLTTSTALLSGSGRNGQPRRVGTGAPQEGEAERAGPSEAGTAEPGDRAEPARDEQFRNRPATPSGVDAPTEPDVTAGTEVAEQPARTEDPTSTGNLGVDSHFGSEESAERFRREYIQPMDDSKQRLEELRMRLTGELRMEENGHSGNGQQQR
ncbi:hypothetical protein SAMN04487820_110249 [Actinopolyspora mzabensis]|uniref:Uncharacterized protein n=1 Tax=Actinopolyspora mzabensis TaxID=995066 RepID=A0A1G9DQZ9_ACTMZ|nr:hypothetical protein [Actinopolyspora mzabensis]SDK66288.1 hypothetical protein SAMN04487820_110249 [Actinopolyspora mzabensis]